ncbi:RNA-binding cell elongation regulator Jag/EloR [Salinicoccus albus]|uniref:RNA-binding cell elongation regulator Jag/EloR n=1 Tax=Salinicoccus albus TaxID=418756 RepID=UPI00037E2D6E|nr:RNA-binding cell elongation regulator Jag/EloR [Salinicoccus albus]
MYRVYKEATVDRAIARGLKELNVTESDIRIDVMDQGRRGLFGIGSKDAEVKLTVINPDLKAYGTIDTLIGRLRETTDSAPLDARDENTPQKETAAHDEAETSVNREDHRSIEAAVRDTQGYVDSIISEMNIDSKSETVIHNNEVRINLESKMAAKLIGKRGATLNALQEIAQNYFNSIYRSYGVIIIDVENYREKRKETLQNLAVNMSKKVVRSNEPVRMEPMPSFERKIMHNVLTEIDDIETYSEGKEPYRYIVIEKK